MKKIVIIFTISFLVCCNQAKKMEKTTLSDLEKTLERSKGFPIDSIKVNITTDNIPDYLIFDEMDYNSPVLIFDGKTGSKINYENKFTGNAFSAKTLNINCKNPQKVLSVIRKKKTREELSIFQYNSSNNTMDEIFNYPILISEFDKSTEKIKETYYIDLIYSDKKCIDTITISKGKFVNYKDNTPVINPLLPRKSESFIYKVNTRKFEKVSSKNI